MDFNNLSKAEQDKIKRLVARDEKSKESHARYNAKRSILLEKAKNAGITVSEDEIDTYLNTFGE